MQLKLPELGEGVHEGELVKWRVKVGDTVKDDQPVCDIMTDKATVELPAPFSGKVTALSAKEGEVIKVGQVILEYEGSGKAAAASSSASAPQAHAPAPMSAAAPASGSQAIAKPASPANQPLQGVGSPGGLAVAAAPATRKLAREMGVELSQIAGSGPNGRIMKEDVERFSKNGGAGAVSAGPARPVIPQGGEERVAFRGLRKKIAEKMRLSKDKAAHFTYVEEADATELVKLRAQAKALGEAQGVKVTYLPFVLKAMVAALRKYPILNSTLDEERQELVYKHYYNIALSVQTDDGLTAPVIKGVETKSILQIAKEINEVVERARNKRLTLDDLQGGTITLTNVGSIGGLFATPVINYPEVAIVGFNKIFKAPVVKGDQIVIRDKTYFSISLDHRVVDGAVGAEFMKLMIQYIENPSLLLLESI